jgi:hypothetical protein
VENVLVFKKSSGEKGFVFFVLDIRGDPTKEVVLIPIRIQRPSGTFMDSGSPGQYLIFRNAAVRNVDRTMIVQQIIWKRDRLTRLFSSINTPFHRPVVPCPIIVAETTRIRLMIVQVQIPDRGANRNPIKIIKPTKRKRQALCQKVHFIGSLPIFIKTRVVALYGDDV